MTTVDPDRQRVGAPVASTPLLRHPGAVPGIIEMAEAVPDRVAIDDGIDALTYHQLLARGATVARRLTAVGVGPGDVVGVMAPRCSSTVVHAFGALASGAVYAPLLTDLPGNRLRELAAIAGLRAVVGNPELTAALPEDVTRVDTRSIAVEAEVGATGFGATPRLGTGAYVMFTSGSAGVPKGVRVPHRALANVLAWARAAFTPSEMAMVAVTTSFGFDPSILQMFAPLDVGGTVRVLPSVLALAELGADVPVTLANGVPSALAELVPLGRFPRSLRTFIVGGEAMPASLARRLYASSAITRLLFAYGPTETTVQVVAHEVGPDAVDPVPLGRELPGVSVHLVDARLREVPDGVVGELCVSGAQVADGYVGRDELSAERFVDSPLAQGGRMYRTGDRALRRADGVLEFRGRIDDQVKICGHRVEPGEVQARLMAHPMVVQAHVGARRLAGVDELIAWVTLIGPPIAARDLRAYLRSQLPAYLVPSRILVLDALPVGPRGKLDMSALPDPALFREASPPEASPPEASGLEASGPEASRPGASLPATERRSVVDVVATAIGEVLGNGVPVRADDHFFDDLGGTSLLAVRLMARLEEVLEVRLPLSVVLSEATVAGLADAVSRLQPDDHLQLVVNAHGEDTPIVLVHAWLGGVLRYRLLAPHLPPSQPLIGIDVHHGGEPVADSIAALADQAIVQLRSVRPVGPYVLGGHSMGGLVSLEMARRLRSEGAEVGEVVLIDVPARVSGWRFWRSEVLLNWADWRTLSWSGRSQRVRTFVNNRRGRFGAQAIGDPDVGWRLAVTNRASLRAVRTYQAASYAGDVTVLATSETTRRNGGRSELGWSALVRGRLTVARIGGMHDTIFGPSEAPVVAAHLVDASRRTTRA